MASARLGMPAFLSRLRALDVGGLVEALTQVLGSIRHQSQICSECLPAI